ncbi:hypothetical protein DYB28_003711 [Aphanomyces astaci]|nr:hypothetical protein DYB36_000809 [Aphanomyces astaci]RHY16862.1 hypothetical protein DYB25_000292 [Aphanomyces astaci]RHY43896.1 hypothetical protein DYB34_004235 [Aphanomyces astaci]RHY58716.1 hypothetical protein DYB38_004102 [Aphanomyces astaci]RHY82657.1 hypothetical protein DYB26_013716 [Aphanomyces astaci]
MGSGSSSDKTELKSRTEKRLSDAKPVSRHMSDAPAYHDMTNADVNAMLEAFTDTTLELSLAREADFIGFLAQHNLPAFDAMPAHVYKLSQLMELNFSHNQLTSLDDAIGELAQLERLDVANNRLAELPSGICKLVRLKTLIVSENQLTALPADLGACTALTKLICFKNQLATLPDSLGGCVPLEEVNLFNNKLTSLGAGFYDLVHLSDVNIAVRKWHVLGSATMLTLSQGNALTQLEPFTKLVNLKRCAAYLNKLKVFPSLVTCTQLTQLQVYRNALKELPDLTNLVLLTDLDANTNQIKTIPPSLCCPQSSLRSLNLRKNRLVALPPFLGNLTHLEILNIGGNPISSPLPVELTHLTTLVALLLDDSNITVLPSELAGMKSLVRVDVGSRIDHSDTTTKSVMDALEVTCDSNKGWLKQS